MGGEGEEFALWEEVNGFDVSDGGGVGRVGLVGVLGVGWIGLGLYFLWLGSFCAWLVAGLGGLVLLLG